MLLRTVHSVLDRTPPNLLYEIVLVDDSSELGMYFHIAINNNIVNVLKLHQSF